MIPPKKTKKAELEHQVALCGVAAGGGLATTENFMYIFSYFALEIVGRDDTPRKINESNLKPDDLIGSDD